MRHRLIVSLLLFLSLLAPGHAAPLQWSELQAKAPPASGQRIAYGRAPSQFGDLRVPEGPGPHPVLVMLHGGCWLRGVGLDTLSHLADALTREAGVATWNLEYRRLGELGGGWPGTLLDAALGTDHLRTVAAGHRLDLTRVASLGHGSGGQLALWLASRERLTPASALYRSQPLALRGTVGLSPITDLETFADAPGSCNAAVDDLLGGSARQHLGRYTQASPRALLPLGVPQWLIHGVLDTVVDVRSAQRYAAEARDNGDAVQLDEIAQAGHLEPVLPGSDAWPAVLKAVRAVLATDTTVQ